MHALVNFKFKCNEVKATVQVALLPGFGAFAGQTGSFTEKDIFSMETCQNRSTACNDEKELGQCAKKDTHFERRAASKVWNCANCNEAQQLSFTYGQKNGWVNAQERFFSPASVGCDFAHATPCEKQFLDDIEALRELHEGDDFVSELNGELRESLFFCMSNPLAHLT